MFKISVKNLTAHKRRLVSTFLAVFLGVSFLSGTLVLGDTLRANFDTLFADANAGTDAVIRNSTTFDVSRSRGPSDRQRGLVDAAVVDEVRAVDGVATAEPVIEGYGQLIGKDGNAIGGNGPPRLAGNWITDPELNPYRLVEGRAPEAADDVVVNRGAADAGDLRIGDTTTVETPDPVTVKIVGIATFGDEDGLGQVTFTAFTLEAAEQHVLGRTGEATRIVAKAAPGVSQQELADRIQPLVPLGTEVITGDVYVAENVDEINSTFLDLFTTFLTVFAAVALLVATFSIYNTFSILVAQRTRESALLRAVGAARRQIVVSVVAEALVIGVVASLTGLFAGVGIAGLLKGLFDSFGFALPAGGVVFKSTTVVISMIVGVAATVGAGLAPAVKASRVAPLAALRDVAVDSTHVSVRRMVVGLVATAIGTGVVISAVTSANGDSMLARAGMGAALTIVGVVVLGPVVARPATAVVGWPVARFRGVTGGLARDNAMRNPRRTSGTASALMIGVGVVTLFTVFAASLKASVDDSVSRSFGGDLAVNTPAFGGGVLSPAVAPTVAALPEVESAVGLGQGAVTVDGSGSTVTVTEPPSLAGVLEIDVVDGTVADVGNGAGKIGVAKDKAEDKGWHVGDTVNVGFTDGTSTPFTIAVIYDDANVLETYLMARSDWAGHAVQDFDTTVMVSLADGVSMADGKAVLERAVAVFGGPEVQDRDEFIAAATQGVDMMLGIVYVLLLLAIIIALMGIANTLSLAVHERTRELGLLRAVGQTRGQVRSMVRWESVLIAVFGTIGGLGVGVFLGWALVQAAGSETIGVFAAPAGQLVVVLVAGAIAGVLAGIRPARRAARLDVLTAIAAE